jgi:hypothetical protein
MPLKLPAALVALGPRLFHYMHGILPRVIGRFTQQTTLLVDFYEAQSELITLGL